MASTRCRFVSHDFNNKQHQWYLSLHEASPDCSLKTTIAMKHLTSINIIRNYFARTHFRRIDFVCSMWYGSIVWYDKAYADMGQNSILNYCITLTSQWVRWCLKSPASRLFTQPTVYSGADQRKHQSSASLAFVRGIHRWPVNSPHEGPVTQKMFPFDDVIMPYWALLWHW